MGTLTLRPRGFHNSLRFKLALGLLLPLVVTLSFFSIMHYLNQRLVLVENLKLSATTAGEIIEGSLEHAIEVGDLAHMQNVMDGVIGQQGVLDLFVVDEAGRVMLSAGSEGQEIQQVVIPLEDATCQVCHQHEATSRNESAIQTNQSGTRVYRNVNTLEGWEDCAVCLAAGEGTSAVLITDFSVAQIDQQLAAVARNSLLWSAGSILAILFIVNLMMNGMVIRPLRRVVAAIMRLREGDLDERVVAGQSDEIGELADSFNLMADGLKEKQQLALRLEERTSALGKAELALESLRRMVSEGPAATLRVAHELRSPAASIYQTVDVLLQGYAGGSYEDQVTMLSLVRDRARAMHAMVNDLLQLGAIRQTERNKKIAPVQLADVLWEVVPAMRIKATLKGVDFQLDLPSSLSPVGARVEHVEQLVSNLVDNAIKYTGPGGEVTVTVKQDARAVIVTVQDTGIGIAPEDVDRVFEEFYRAPNAKDMEPYGTGLGLAVARRIVELYGGRLELTSGLGKGTTFVFSLPKFVEREHSAAAKASTLSVA